jgi:hypothetical protein
MGGIVAALIQVHAVVQAVDNAVEKPVNRPGPACG